MKNIHQSLTKKRSKVIVPVFAANTSSGFVSYEDVAALLPEIFKDSDILTPEAGKERWERIFSQSEPDKAAKRDFAGNLEDLAFVLHFLRDIGVTDVAELPFTQKHGSYTSPFSSSLFGLDLDYLVLELVPEVQEDPDLLAMIPKRPMIYENDMCCDFDIHREARRVILAKAVEKFFSRMRSEPSSSRSSAYRDYAERYREQLTRNAVFFIVQSKVLNTYVGAKPDFRTWPKEYQNPGSEAVRRLAELNRDAIESYKYGQFCIHEQQLLIKDLYMALGLKREVNIAFGIDPASSGDVWGLQGKGFDIGYEIGTDNGQKWGIPPYITDGDAYYELMNDRIRYLAQYIDIVFLDHMCGYATQYIMKHGDDNDYGRYEIDPQDRTRIVGNVEKMIRIVLSHGLETGGETLGDIQRQSAVEEAIRRVNMSGHPIPEMHVAPHKNFSGQYADPRTLPENTELFLSTHDLPTIVQMLCCKRGSVVLNDFRYPEHKIANFLSQQFGILTTPNQTPLDPEDITTEMGIAMLEAFMNSSAGTATIPLQDIFALLFPQEVGVKEYYNLNIAGTSSRVGNENKNFSRILPPIQKLEPFREQLKEIFTRPGRPFDYPQRLTEHGDFFTWIANITPGRKLIYQNPQSRRWGQLQHQKAGVPILEMVVSNLTAVGQIGTVELPEEFRHVINLRKKYKLWDIASPKAVPQFYYKTGEDMLGHIYIELPERTDHHFVIYELPEEA